MNLRRGTEIAGWTMVWSGLFVFGYLGWQLFGTDLVNQRVQAEAGEEWAQSVAVARAALPQAEEVEAPQGKTVTYHPEPEPEAGEEMARLRIPRIGVDVVVFAGVDPEVLSNGPGHMPGTPLPGQPGNAVLSGHRTTHGRPFFDLDLLAPGDRIEVETAIGVHVYQVREPGFVVEPTEVWVLRPREGAWLTLTTCHPKFSARQRLIVVAELVEGPNRDYVDALEERLEDVA